MLQNYYLTFITSHRLYRSNPDALDDCPVKPFLKMKLKLNKKSKNPQTNEDNPGNKFLMMFKCM